MLLLVLLVGICLPPATSAISCYNFTSVEGDFSDESTVSGCLACMRYTTIYNTKTVQYTMYQWACSLQPSTSLSAPTAANAPKCIASTTVVTYGDGSLYNKACTCCSNYCNVEDFCEPTPEAGIDCNSADGGTISNHYLLTLGTSISLLLLLLPSMEHL